MARLWQMNRRRASARKLAVSPLKSRKYHDRVWQIFHTRSPKELRQDPLRSLWHASASSCGKFATAGRGRLKSVAGVGAGKLARAAWESRVS